MPAAPRVPGYRVRELLGRGGFAAVFAAEREADGVRVALKVAHPSVAFAREQLENEAAVLLAVGPPAVPAFLGKGVLLDGSPFLALELVEGPSLAARLLAAGLLPAGQLVPVFLAILDAVLRLHAAGFAHGDLKPENIFLSGDPLAARLLDMGVSRRLVGDPASERPTAQFAGTPEYMSPEQCQGLPPDARSDVYAAGVLLLEMATGRPPFFGPAAEVRHAHLNLRPPPPATLGPVPPALAQLIQQCLAKAPEDRFPTAAALRQALAQSLYAVPPPPDAGPPVPVATGTAAPRAAAWA